MVDYLEVVQGKDWNVIEVDVLSRAVELFEFEIGSDEVTATGIDLVGVNCSGCASSHKTKL